MLLLLTLIVGASCFNPFSAITLYFTHDEVQNITDSEKHEEINFYRDVEQKSVINSLVSGGISTAIGLPMLLGVATGGIGALPLAIPLLIGSYSVSNGFVSMMSKDKKNEMRFRASDDYKIWKDNLINILEDNQRLNQHSKWAFYLSFICASVFFYFVIFHGRRGLMFAIIAFLIFCFVESFLLTTYIEYGKTVKRREVLVEQWGNECNFNLLAGVEKILNKFNFWNPIKYEKETGYITNDPNCNWKKEEINEIIVTPLDVLTLMGIKNTIRNVKLFYNGLLMTEKIFGLCLFMVMITFMILVSRLVPKREPIEEEKKTKKPGIAVNYFTKIYQQYIIPFPYTNKI